MRIKKYLFAGIVFFSLILMGETKGNPLSDDARISLLTCQPGNDVYSVFGHSAIHVSDPVSDVDLVFNYGVFSFSSDHFIWNFVRGKTDYKLAIQSMNRFKQEYHAEGRWVVSHTFNLNRRQKNELLAFLLENSKPENATYRYNFFFDNCATRIRDVLFNIIQDSIKINYRADYFFTPPDIHEKKSILTNNHKNNPRYTFRNLIDLYLQNHPWLDFGIDIALGRDTDKTASLYEQMFLPDFLMFILSNATQKINGVRFPVVSSYELLVNPAKKIEPKSLSFLFHPTFIMLIVLILSVIITIYGLIDKKSCYLFDASLFILLGLVGLSIFFISYFSAHPVVRPNFNLLWIHPLHLFFGVLLLCNKNKPHIYSYHYLSITLLIMFFFVWISGIQHVHPASMMIAVILFIRGVFGLRFRKKLKQRKASLS